MAVAAAHALARGVARVAIVDFDVHHGNGTQEIFEADPRVLYVSTHQWPLYPGTGPADDVGAGAGRGFTVNVPLERGATDGDYDLVFDDDRRAGHDACSRRNWCSSPPASTRTSGTRSAACG